MRALIVADVVGGVQTFVRELVRALPARGVEIHLALLGQAEPDFDGARSCEVRNLRLEWMESPWADIETTAEWIEECRCRVEPDVVHMNTFAPVLDPNVPVLLTVHSCVLTWWRAVHGVVAPAAWAPYARLARRALCRALLLAVPTRALLDDLAVVYGELPDARVIPNGRAVSAHGGMARERLVVTAGRLWDGAKNAPLLARAAPAIDGRVALIGPGGVPGLEPLGNLSERDVLRWLSRAAVFAEPARYEPFGLAALEAALCGCALVLGDISSLREVWGDAATFVSPDDADALAAAVNSLLDDPVRRAQAAGAARRVALRYTPDSMAAAYARCYRELARMEGAITPTVAERGRMTHPPAGLGEPGWRAAERVSA
jgi:glycosyltransferase involved in cell wall biosynthesis